MKLTIKNILYIALAAMFFTLIPVALYYLMIYYGKVLDAGIQMLILVLVLFCTIPMLIVLFPLFIMVITKSISFLKTKNNIIVPCLSIIISIIGIYLLIIETGKYFTILAEKLDEISRLG